jgi:cell division protein FtsQ
MRALRVKLGVKILIIGALFFGLIIFVHQRQARMVCKKIIINVDNQHNNYFIKEADVMDLLTASGERHVVGASLVGLDIKALEKEVEAHEFVHKAEVYKDLKGNLLVNATQSRPIARLLLNGRSDAYISAEGELMPFSDHFTARVPLVSGAFTEKLLKMNLQEDEVGKQYFELLKTLDQDEFWKAQIAHIEIDRQGEIILYPQVTKQYVEFGKAENIDNKLRKLKIFYKKILPFKGWNHYYRVNLKYHNQIVCE